MTNRRKQKIEQSPKLEQSPNIIVDLCQIPNAGTASKEAQNAERTTRRKQRLFLPMAQPAKHMFAIAHTGVKESFTTKEELLRISLRQNSSPVKSLAIPDSSLP
jgi:hypothetical protein